jgi:quinol-cytochrome oxidoreductase complex cytochrome b subunit
MNWRGLGDMKLYRRKWAETDNALVNEARAQTLAIQRLQVWLRLAYAILAVAALLGYWGFTTPNGLVAGIIGAVLGVCAFIVVAVLRTGISNGRKNVNAMLEELQSQVVQ